MKIAAMPEGHGGDRAALRGPARLEQAGSPGHSVGARAQLRSERGAGVVAVDEVSAAGVTEVSVAAGAADVSVVVVVVVSVSAVLFSVEDGLVVLVALFDIELSLLVAAGVACVVVVVVVSVDCATAAPMPASRAAAAATADNFF